ncbi:hypothetical protein ANCCEY_03008 [Ancylostoma ceylanicum]|uniref:Uncharacterized protein n=1 Tax=Ancylostoma ceylanicum TaxID=53326 RepID=A0A0D6M1I9_9BILA|nr:hypothetical protein ANCCEY_03008 [Ancylostoma ceylanicum]
MLIRNRRSFDTTSGYRQDQVDKPLISALRDEWLFYSSFKSWPEDNKYDGNVNHLAFANILHANKTAVGCYEAKCGNTGAAACVFNLPDLAKDELIYKAGNPCTNDSDCSTYKPSMSNLALGKVERDNGLPLPPASNMRELRYSCRLELLARRDARKCAETSPPRTGYAIYTEDNYSLVPKRDAKDYLAALEKGKQDRRAYVRTRSSLWSLPLEL